MNNQAGAFSIVVADDDPDDRLLIKDAFDSGDERQLHIETLAELGNSLEMEIAPRAIELEERTITLSGSVEDQYDQWRDILADIYANDVGEAASSD